MTRKWELGDRVLHIPEQDTGEVIDIVGGLLTIRWSEGEVEKGWDADSPDIRRDEV